MNTEQIKPEPMIEDQLKGIKNQIVQTYLFLIGKTDCDTEAIEVMKLSASQLSLS